MDVADQIWNRAAVESGGSDPRHGDTALASVLGLHSVAMSGGLLNAVEHATHEELEAAEAGFRWLRLDAAAGVVAMVRGEIEAGALDDDDRAEALEGRVDDQYLRVVSTDQTLVDAFRTRLAEEPQAFTSV